MPRLSPLNIALLAAISLALLLLALRHDPGPGLEVERREAPGRLDQIVVHISGAVHQPGVYTADPGDRVDDIITEAGGLAENADATAINLALRVRDQDHLHVPLIGEASPLLDLNLATTAELEALPGIGAVYAARIIEARSALPFTSPDDLIERATLPDHVYEDIRTLVTAVTP